MTPPKEVAAPLGPGDRLKPGERFPFTVLMSSDWQISAGAGEPGGLDTLVRVRQRAGMASDDPGQPYVPATTMTGLLREAVRTVALALAVRHHTALAWVPALFGDTRTSPLLAIEPALRLEGCQLGVRAATAIDPESQRALTGSLRFEQVVGPGTLGSALTLNPEATWSGEQTAAAQQILTVAAALVDGVGGARRRGLGAARLSLPGQPALLLQELLDNPLPAPPPLRLAPSPAELPTTGPEPDQGWTSIDLQVDLTGPLLALKEVRGNQLLTYPHLPGSVLLPWVCARLRAAGIADTQRWVQAGALIVTAATPLLGGQRSHPTPLCFVRPKDDTVGELRNQLLSHANPDAEPGAAERPERGGYAVLNSGGAIQLGTAQLGRALHNHIQQLPAAVGPATTETALYSVQHLLPGQLLGAQVLLRADLVSELPAGTPVQSWLTDPRARLGGKSRSEYGAAAITATQPSPPAQPLPSPPLPDGPQSVVVLLHSDTLVRDSRLRLSADPDDLRRELQSRLDLPALTAAPDPAGEVAVATRTHRHDGWHSPSGLPRPSLPALAAGTVLRLTWHGQPPHPAAVHALHTEGVGDRRAEGFGRVRLDPELLTEPGRTWSAQPTADLSTGHPQPPHAAPPVGARSALVTVAAAPAVTAASGPGWDGPGARDVWRADVVLSLGVASDLHVGGFSPPVEPQPFGRDRTAVVHQLARTAAGTVMIPGTTVAGALRQLARRHPDPAVRALFGGPDQASELLIADADVELPDGVTDWPTRVRGGLSRHTGAAAAGVLHAWEVIPAGSAVRVHLSVHSDSSDTEQALRLLCREVTAGGLRLGRATSRGAGHLCNAAAPRISGAHCLTTRDGLLSWLTRTGTDNPDWQRNQPAALSGELVLTLHWRPVTGMLLTADAPARFEVDGRVTEVAVPRLRYLETDAGPAWVPYLTGTAVAGALRARASRIARTVTTQTSWTADTSLRTQIQTEPPLLRRLFGDTQRAATLSVQDTHRRTGLTPQQYQDLQDDTATPAALATVGRRRSHIALDRWSGAVAAGRLFNVLSADADPDGWEPLTLRLDLTRLSAGQGDAACCLLAIVLAEAATGTLPLGGRGTRGLGHIEITAVQTSRPGPEGNLVTSSVVEAPASAQATAQNAQDIARQLLAWGGQADRRLRAAGTEQGWTALLEEAL